MSADDVAAVRERAVAAALEKLTEAGVNQKIPLPLLESIVKLTVIAAAPVIEESLGHLILRETIRLAARNEGSDEA